MHDAWSAVFESNNHFLRDPKLFSDPLLMELQAVPLALEIAKATKDSARERKLIGRTAIVAGSVNDLLEIAGINSILKSGFTLFPIPVDTVENGDIV